tara:strand:- start:87 stop:272 length:186 start_codon:yes stop_codon:yes gene_type:complete
MTPAQIKDWKRECKRYKKELGYVPAEVQMLPMILNLVDDNLLDIGIDKDLNILLIKSKGEQ